jgi:hypothetical protein
MSKQSTQLLEDTLTVISHELEAMPSREIVRGVESGRFDFNRVSVS